MRFKFVEGKEKRVRQAGFEQLTLSFQDIHAREQASAKLNAAGYVTVASGNRYITTTVPVAEPSLSPSKRIKSCEDLVAKILNKPEAELQKPTPVTRQERSVLNKIILVRLKYNVHLHMHMQGAIEKISKAFPLKLQTDVRKITPTNDSADSYYIWQGQFELQDLVKAAKISGADNSETRRKKVALEINNLLSAYTPEIEIRVSEKEIALPQTPPEPKTPKLKKIKPDQPKQKILKTSSERKEEASPNVQQIQKSERKKLLDTILTDLTSQPNKNPSRQICITKLFKTTDGKHFLIMWGGDDQKHTQRQSGITKLNLGTLSERTTITNNGHGALNCSIFEMQADIVETIKQKYSQQKAKKREEEKAAAPLKFADGITPTGLNSLEKAVQEAQPRYPRPSLLPAGYPIPKNPIGIKAILLAKQLVNEEPPLEEVQETAPHKEPKPRPPQPQRNGVITNLLYDSAALLKQAPLHVKQLFIAGTIKAPTL